MTETSPSLLPDARIPGGARLRRPASTATGGARARAATQSRLSTRACTSSGSSASMEWRPSGTISARTSLARASVMSGAPGMAAISIVVDLEAGVGDGAVGAARERFARVEQRRAEPGGAGDAGADEHNTAPVSASARLLPVTCTSSPLQAAGELDAREARHGFVAGTGRRPCGACRAAAAPAACARRGVLSPRP